MNEEIVAPGHGFGTHPHNGMEIVTYVLTGALEHKDSMGNGEELRPGEFQQMTAGTGITRSKSLLAGSRSSRPCIRQVVEFFGSHGLAVGRLTAAF